MSQQGINRYKQMSVTTANRGQVLLMLYEGCMNFLRRAIRAIEARNAAEKGLYIGKAQDIINELACTLNFEAGGAVAKELERLYNYMTELVTDANIRNDAKPLEQTIKLLDTLYQGWKVAVDQVNKQGGAANGPATPAS